jgi:hypothetical protein
MFVSLVSLWGSKGRDQELFEILLRRLVSSSSGHPTPHSPGALPKKRASWDHTDLLNGNQSGLRHKQTQETLSTLKCAPHNSGVNLLFSMAPPPLCGLDTTASAFYTAVPLKYPVAHLHWQKPGQLLKSPSELSPDIASSRKPSWTPKVCGVQRVLAHLTQFFSHDLGQVEHASKYRLCLTHFYSQFQT